MGSLKINIGRGRTLSDPLSTQESVNRMVNLQLQGDKLRRPRYGPREESLLGIFETAKPLHIAADTGHLPIARMLLAYGASVDGEETNLATPLHYAAKNGQTAMVKVLLEAEANPNALDSMLRSPCMSAIESDSVDIIRLLLKYGADLQLRSWYGETALQLAADYAAKDVFVLLMTRSDLCAEDVDGYSLLSSTIRNAAAFPMNFVTNFCPPSEVYKTRRYSILNAAVANRSMTDVKLLLRRIPTNVLPRLLNHRDVNATPLDVAARLSKLETMNLLLDAGAQLEIEGSDHGTPLMAACATGRLAAVRLLVGRGARTSYVERGRTFGALAAARHHPEIRRWLLVGRFLEGRKLLGC